MVNVARYTKEDLPHFTGLRGLAALLVLFYHIRDLQNQTLTFSLVDAFSKFGELGVDVFFVLSGFILSVVYEDSFSARLNWNDLHRYGWARFSRIYPLHFVMLFMMFGAYAIALRVGVTPKVDSGYGIVPLILSLVLIQEWVGVVSPNPGSWSISIEFANYLLFPIFLSRASRLPRWWPWLALIGGAVVVEFVPDIRIVRGMAEFIMGCAAFSASKNYRVQPFWALSGILFITPFFASEIIGHKVAGLAAICFAMSVYLLALSDSRDPFVRLCTARPVVFVGVISYSVYLIQWFIWIGWKHMLVKSPLLFNHPYLMVLCASISIIVCSVASYYWFEKPMRTWLRRRDKLRESYQDALLSARNQETGAQS